MLNDSIHVHWTGRWKMDDEPDPDDPMNTYFHSREIMFPYKPKLRIPQVEIEIKYLDHYNEIVTAWVRLDGNEELRGIVPDEFIDTGKIIIYG
ncbi:MAG: hypothetical protein CL489_08485 [Acidobacteria bacterium]|nr:hypothetical protein [Acidobacteriota bacterium]|tara:strand:- start:49732 stop:50010 length:279 start_codon:yes stop_codon:yes gene_type:complete